MREIKFRYWTGENISYINLGDGWYDMPKDMEFQQFTGLKDKNGKEIYEGDILFRKDADRIDLLTRVRGHQAYYEVIFHQGDLDDSHDSYYGKFSCVGFALKEIEGAFKRKVDIDVVPVPTFAGRERTDPIIQKGGVYSIFTSTKNPNYEIIGNIYENPNLIK
jgi:hypothetical protein